MDPNLHVLVGGVRYGPHGGVLGAQLLEEVGADDVLVAPAREVSAEPVPLLRLRACKPWIPNSDYRLRSAFLTASADLLSK